jgi:hypothetical protein
MHVDDSLHLLICAHSFSPPMLHRDMIPGPQEGQIDTILGRISTQKQHIRRMLVDIAEQNVDDRRYQGPNDPLPDADALERIPCSVCHIVSAGHNNYVLYCDGAGCFRAYHQHCLRPVIPSKVVKEWPRGKPW